MKITDLVSEYARDILASDNFKAYENSYPALFNHYYRFCGNRKKPFSKLPQEELTRRSKLIRKELIFINDRIAAFGLNIDELDIILFVGKGASNGHAFRDGGRFVVWLPIETYDSQLLARIFITHEIIHALHYAGSPEFYFDSAEEMRSISRRLITEGLATYLTMKILGVDALTALWADYLPDHKADRWFDECRLREKEIYADLLANFSFSNPDVWLFYAADPDNILKYRAGYYAGLRLIQQIIDEGKIEPIDLLTISRKKFEGLIIDRLQRYI